MATARQPPPYGPFEVHWPEPAHKATGASATTNSARRLSLTERHPLLFLFSSIFVI